MKNLNIRNEKKEDFRAVENLIRESFWNVYRPGCLEHYVIHKLRDDKDFIPELNFVMEQNGEIIGQIAFVRGHITADNGTLVPVSAMGPICISPKLQRQGYGKILLDFALKEAKKLGIKTVCLEGNIDFYSKCGFELASNKGLRYHGMPEGVDAPFFLCNELEKDYLKDITGEYAPPSGYLVDENEAEEFDKAFPPKEKKVLPTQLF